MLHFLFSQDCSVLLNMELLMLFAKAEMCYVALVSRHDRESAGLPDREHVPNR